MRNLLFVILSLCCSFGSVSAHDIDKSSQDESFRREANVLLTEWMDTFLNYQCSGLGSSLDGGVLCPACASWDMFKDYADRSAQFVAAAKEIAEEEGQLC